MSRKNDRLITGLEAYGLTRREFRRLGRTGIQVEVHLCNAPHVYPSPARFRTLLAKSPEERRDLVRQWRVRQHKRLCNEVSPHDCEVLYYNDDPVGLRATIEAREAVRIAGLGYVQFIKILCIPGMQRRNLAAGREPRWFAIQARFAIQYEWQTTGLQTYEDRIIMVLARSEREAQKKAMREFREYESPRLTVTGHFFRWGFERILDIVDVGWDTIDPDGTEIYSELRKRRMKPEFEWHPGHEPSR